jgi:hypothetical protein
MGLGCVKTRRHENLIEQISLRIPTTEMTISGRGRFLAILEQYSSGFEV